MTVEKTDPHRMYGRVSQVIGLVIEPVGPEAEVGELCHIEHDRHADPIPAEVVGFKGDATLLMPLAKMHGVSPGDRVQATGVPLRIHVGPSLLGRVVDATGRPIDDLGSLNSVADVRSIHADAPDPLSRTRITEQVTLGVQAIDAFTPMGKGQRMGIFSGSGVGKSSLLGMMARGTDADINVIALVGERGREVREFIERDLGSEGLKRSVVVVATGDQPAVLRIKAAQTATTIAEYFRDQGKDVLFMMDSVTRFAMAQREIGLAVGEPPSTRGYTPSVFAMLPELLERAGTAGKGSITGLYTVLVEGDDMNEPIADAVRGILDGHIVLSRDLAHKGHYPAVDILQSVSRLQTELLSDDQQQAAQVIRQALAVHADKEDLISVGAYAVGTDPQIDYAIAKKPEIDQFLRQGLNEHSTADEAKAALTALGSDGPTQYI